MKDEQSILGKMFPFKIVLAYAAVSGIYIYTSDYFLHLVVSDLATLSNFQTFKGLGFILITSALLYVLVKRNNTLTATYYKQIIDVKQISDDKAQKSIEEYMSLFDHSPLPMWMFDPETLRFIFVNNAACKNYGYSHEEFQKMTLYEIRPPEEIPVFKEIHQQTKTSDNQIVSGILKHQKKNGEVIQVKIKVAGITFNGKKVRLVSATDVTNEMRAQTSLEDTNASLRRACEIAAVGYWTTDLTNSEMRWSTNLYDMFECDPNTFKLSLDSVSAMFHPDDRKQFNPAAFAQLEENKINESEHRIITSSGKLKWILERLYLTKNENGVPIKLEGIALDITKRKLHEQEIWESHERFKILSDATFEAIIDWDLKTNTVMWGEGFRTMFGYDIKNCSKYIWLNGIHPDDKRNVLSELGKTLKNPTKSYFNSEFRFLKADGEIAYVQHRGVFIRDAKGRVTRALAAMTDLTETISRMRKIEQQNEVLRDIAWTQSHVVRAPLANILGLAALLKENFENGKRDREFINHICDSAERLDKIIHEIVRKTERLDQV